MSYTNRKQKHPNECVDEAKAIYFWTSMFVV